MQWDLVIKGGRVIDGTGMHSFTADIAVRDGRIAKIGRVLDGVPDPLSLEQAISRLTLMPATVHGLADRGLIREGAYADLVLLDLARLSCGSARLARDFPAETERYVIDADGYVMVLVNGEVVMDGGQHTGSLPGHVLRGG